MTLAVTIAPTAEAVATEVRVETVTDYQGLLDLEPVWNDLVEAAGIDHPFLSHEWVRTWWECFGRGKDLHILVVKDGTQPIAIAPLMRSRGWMYGLRVHQLESIANDHTPRFDFIVGRSSKEAYGAIWDHLRRQTTRWDVLRLAQVPGGSPTLEELPRLAAGAGCPTGLWRSNHSPYVSLVGGWESYLKGLDAKHRSNLRNRLRRLSQRGEVGFETISSAAEVASALNDGLRLEAAAWKGEAGTAIRCQPERESFYRRFAERATQRDWLRLQFLTVERQRIAFHFSVCYRDKLYLLKPGYDPEYAPYSPSNLLCWMVLRDAFDRRLQEFDFLGVDEDWKREWARATRPHYWLFVFPNSPRARLLHHIKFRLVPRLRQYPLYPALRDTVLGLRNGVRSRENHKACK